MKPIPFKEIKHLLPQDSHYNKDEYFLDKEVLLHEGDWVVNEPLDLDQPELLLADGDCPEFPPFILVTGNMTAKNIFNEETDGSTGLMVLGNLSAENIVVGGQELYVKGDLKVNGLFWGDYNHGELIVEGKIEMKVFLNTDYQCDYDRFTKGKNMEVSHVFWDDVDDDVEDNKWITAWFRPEFLEDEDELLLSGEEIWSWQCWLHKGKILEALKEGKNILNEVPVSPEETQIEKIPSLFPNDLINLENLKIFTNSGLTEKDEDSPWCSYEYWDGGVYRRLLVTENRDVSQTQIIFQFHEDNFILCTYYPAYGEVRLSFNDQIFESQQTEFFTFDDHPERFILFQKEWRIFQKQVSEAAYYQNKFHQTFTKPRVDALLALSYVKDELSDYKNDDSIYHWKNFGWQFRQETEGGSLRITITEDLNQWDENDEGTFDFYHIEFENDKPVLMTQYGNGYEFDLYYVHYSKTEKYKKAIAYFEYMEEKLGLLNDQYLKQQEINTNQKELLLAFIEMEDMQLQSGMFDNKWYAEHWETLKNAAIFADELLGEQELKKLFFHLFRKGHLPYYGIEQYKIFEDAYKAQTKYFDSEKYGYPFTSMKRLTGLFLFGFDDERQIAVNIRKEADYRRFLTAWNHFSGYDSIPAIVENKGLIKELANDDYIVNRIIKTLESLDFRHDFPKYEQDYNYTNPAFWAMIAYLKESPLAEATTALNQFKDNKALPFYEKQMEILERLELNFKTKI